MEYTQSQQQQQLQQEQYVHQQQKEMTLENLYSMLVQERQSCYQCDMVQDAAQAEAPLYLTWRHQMIQWQFALANTCQFQRETVEIATSILDRFVSTQRGWLLQDPYQYQLACMACLYTAAKINEKQCFCPAQMESLSGGRFPASDIEAMERRILPAIGWRVSPPTALSFCRFLLELTPLPETSKSTSPSLDKTTLLELVGAHIEVAMLDSQTQSFLSLPPSMMALVCLMTSLQTLVVAAVAQHAHCSTTNATNPAAAAFLQQYLTAFCQALRMDASPAFQTKLACLKQSLKSLVLDSLQSGATSHELLSALYPCLDATTNTATTFAPTTAATATATTTHVATATAATTIAASASAVPVKYHHSGRQGSPRAVVDHNQHMDRPSWLHHLF